MRVVSVLPSATEIVAALGHSSDLVGRSAECDYPHTIRDRAIVMRPRTDDSVRNSREIDERVRASRSRGESLYTLDLEALRRLRPDLVITQNLCGVCSVTDEEVRAACAKAGIAPTLISLTPTRLEEVWESVSTVADALGDPHAGSRVRHELERRTRLPLASSEEPRIAIMEWLDPPILAGLWVSDMARRAGGRSVGPESGAPGVRTSWTELAGLRPDLVVLSPCSFSVDRTRHEILGAGLYPEFRRLAPAHGIYLADEAYFSRPGPRLADGVELLRAILKNEPLPRPMPVRRWTAEEARAR